MKTQESIRILLSLYVTIRQNYDALVFHDTYLSEEVLQVSFIPSRKQDNIDEAIIESLWFQLILKSCSFVEEWDSFLAVKTNSKDNSKLLLIKKIVVPARKEINKWKELKKFRNEIIAHNLRNSKKSFSLDDMHTYDSPQTLEELFYLVAYLERMMRVLSVNFPDEVNAVMALASKALKETRNYPSSRTSKEFEDNLIKTDVLIEKKIRELIGYDLITNLTIRPDKQFFQ